MAIEVTVTDPQTNDDQKSPKPGEKQTSMDLNLRKGVDGSVMIFDHDDIDIVILPEQGKIVALPKEVLTDEVYDTQNHLFRHLAKKGIVEFDSVKGGNVYGAIEAVIQKSAFESTELGEVPHEETKGSLRPGWVRGPYGIYDMYRV